VRLLGESDALLCFVLFFFFVLSSLFLSFFRICVCLSLSVMSVFPSLLYFLLLSPCAFPGSFLPVFFSLFARLCFSWVFLFVLVSRSWCLCFSFPSSCSSSPPPFLFGPFSGYYNQRMPCGRLQIMRRPCMDFNAGVRASVFFGSGEEDEQR